MRPTSRARSWTSRDCSRAAGTVPAPTITVGVSGAFAENQIVAEMYAQVLEAAGYTVDRQLDLASREIRTRRCSRATSTSSPSTWARSSLFLDPNAPAVGRPGG